MSSSKTHTKKYFITPAELLMLRQPTGSSADEIITCTLKELVLNGALKADVVRSKNIFDEADMAHTYILRGERFHDFKSLPFHSLYLQPFKKKPIKVPTHLYAYKVLHLYQEDLTKVKKAIHNELISKGYSRKSFLNFFGRFHLTDTGKKLVSEIEEFIQYAETHLAYQMKHAPLDALEIIRKLGPHISLLENFSFQEMDVWRVKLIKELSKIDSPDELIENHEFPWLYYTDEENQTLDMRLIFDKNTAFKLLGERFDKAIEFGLESDFGT